jgi:hypothetical protein
MFAALLAAVLFAVSAICGYRSSRQIGGAEANFWRICAAIFFLALWAHIFGSGLAGAALPYFVMSGFFGIGLGDTGYFPGPAAAGQPPRRPAHAMLHSAVRHFDRMALARHQADRR